MTTTRRVSGMRAHAYARVPTRLCPLSPSTHRRPSHSCHENLYLSPLAVLGNLDARARGPFSIFEICPRADWISLLLSRRRRDVAASVMIEQPSSASLSLSLSPSKDRAVEAAAAAPPSLPSRPCHPLSGSNLT